MSKFQTETLPAAAFDATDTMARRRHLNRAGQAGDVDDGSVAALTRRLDRVHADFAQIGVGRERVCHFCNAIYS